MNALMTVVALVAMVTAVLGFSLGVPPILCALCRWLCS